MERRMIAVLLAIVDINLAPREAHRTKQFGIVAIEREGRRISVERGAEISSIRKVYNGKIMFRHKYLTRVSARGMHPARMSSGPIFRWSQLWCTEEEQGSTHRLKLSQWINRLFIPHRGCGFRKKNWNRRTWILLSAKSGDERVRILARIAIVIYVELNAFWFIINHRIIISVLVAGWIDIQTPLFTPNEVYSPCPSRPLQCWSLDYREKSS